MEKEFERVESIVDRFFIPIKLDPDEARSAYVYFRRCAEELLGKNVGTPLIVLAEGDAPLMVTSYLPQKLEEFLSAFLEEGHSAEKLQESKALVEMLFSREGHFPKEDPFVLDLLMDAIDPVKGGFATKGKFPLSYPIEILLEHKEHSQALFLAKGTLSRMARSAIYDQIGGGFFTACIDSNWKTIILQKKMAQNAHLAKTYLKAFEVTKDLLYRNICIATIEYLLTMQGCAEGQIDLEEEHPHYTWTADEVERALGVEGGELFSRLYDISYEKRTLPYLIGPLNELADEIGVSIDDLDPFLMRAKGMLLRVREGRKAVAKQRFMPLSDLSHLISALAVVGKALGIEKYVQKGETLFKKLGKARTLEEVVTKCRAALSLFEATGKKTWLVKGEMEVASSVSHFPSPVWEDDFVPALGSQMVQNYLDLFIHHKSEPFLEKAEALLETFVPSSHTLRNLSAMHLASCIPKIKSVTMENS